MGGRNPLRWKKITEIPRESFLGSLSVVDQEITLFEDSISENIKMWDKSITDYEVILASRDAQIYQDIMRVREGMNTRLMQEAAILVVDSASVLRLQEFWQETLQS